MALRLRLRHPDGQSTLSLPAESTISQLLAEISKSTSIAIEALEIRTGFPQPKVLHIPSDRTVLASTLGLRSGDTLVIARTASSAAAPVAPVKSASVAPAASVPSSQPKSQTKSSPEGTYEPTVDGNLVIRVVPDDNSCLFRAAGLVLLPGEDDAATILRKVVADKIRSDPMTYSDAILGQPRNNYITAILNPKTWGGAIELSILSQEYDQEIAAVDIASGRVDSYSSGSNASRVLLLYSGIHYDACTLSPLPPEDFNTMDFDTRSFPTSDQSVVEACQRLAAKLKAKRYYTDTANFTLKCEVCKEGLKGEKEATAHAKATGHASFGEY